MIKIVVISLLQASDRRKNVEDQMAALGLEFEFIDAVDGRVGEHPLLQRQDEEQFILNFGRSSMPGEVGCYASHFLAWQRAVELDEPVLILEDDVALFPNVMEGLSSAEKATERLGFIRLEEPSTSSKFYPVGQIDGFTFKKFSKMSQSLTGYIVTPDVARQFIDKSDRFRHPVDVFIRNFQIHGQSLYGMFPPILTPNQAEFETNIGHRKRGESKSLGLRLHIIWRKLTNMTGIMLMNIRQWTASETIKRNWGEKDE